MDGQQVSIVTEILMDILIGSFSLATISWIFVGIQEFFNNRKEEKRKEEQYKRDEEYHEARMKEILKK